MADQKIDIDYVAKLARIDLTDTERETFGAQLRDVLAHFEKLNAVDVSGVEPSAHAFDVVNVWGEDQPGPTLAPEEALNVANKQKDNQVVMPKVVGGE